MSVVNGLLTALSGLTQVELNYFFTSQSLGAAPIAATTYVFLGKPEPWEDELSPPLPLQDQATLKQTFKDMFAAKLLTASNLAPVVKRVDWTSGTVYAQYDDVMNATDFDSTGLLIGSFYVKNSFDQIFKCLDNNRGGPSTVEPVIAPGTTNVTEVIGNQVLLADGYKWIYVTTIDKGLKQRFYDTNWMPIAIGTNTPNPMTTQGLGSIDVITVKNGGNNYTNGIGSTTKITITGDGQGAVAIANVSGNTIHNVVVTNPGNNYTYATVSVTDTVTGNGTGAILNPIISPIGGHGYDPVSELLCRNIMLSIEFNGTEGGALSTSNVNFRQVGVIVNPLLSNGDIPTESIYNTSDIVTVNYGTGEYQPGEQVFQGTSTNPTFTGVVSGFDASNNKLSVINTVGTYSIGQVIKGSQSTTSRIMVNYQKSDFSVGSGYLYYYENRTPVTRTAGDNQQIRLVLKF